MSSITDSFATDAPLSITTVIHPRDGVPDPRSRTFWTATANALYLVRRPGCDLFGPTPDLPIGWRSVRTSSTMVDEVRSGAMPIRSRGSLCGRRRTAPRPSIGRERRSAITRSAGCRHTGRAACGASWCSNGWTGGMANGMVADWAIHALADPAGGWVRKPHVHVLLTHRFWRTGRRTGEPNPAWCGSPKRRGTLAADWAAIIDRYG